MEYGWMAVSIYLMLRLVLFCTIPPLKDLPRRYIINHPISRIIYCLTALCTLLFFTSLQSMDLALYHYLVQDNIHLTASYSERALQHLKELYSLPDFSARSLLRFLHYCDFSYMLDGFNPFVPLIPNQNHNLPLIAQHINGNNVVEIPMNVVIIWMRPPGLSPDEIESLGIFNYQQLAFTEDEECCICLGEFHGNDLVRRIPECGHVYHRDCIDGWLSRRSICPRCNSRSGLPR